MDSASMSAAFTTSKSINRDIQSQEEPFYDTISEEFTKAHLVWHKTVDSHIWDIDFRSDETIVYIKSKASGEVSRKELSSMNLKGMTPVTLRKLKRINLKGSKVSMDPPVLFYDPIGISSNLSTESLAICDYEE